eukprot:GILK01013708.1.p1 GENE.GILK01013708.1~~GILK01013708.1.p1  ORF type:complete len:136 (-),score=13.12 GILK01013708.1:124-531(-)
MMNTLKEKLHLTKKAKTPEQRRAKLDRLRNTNEADLSSTLDRKKTKLAYHQRRVADILEEISILEQRRPGYVGSAPMHGGVGMTSGMPGMTGMQHGMTGMQPGMQSGMQSGIPSTGFQQGGVGYTQSTTYHQERF